MSAPKKKPPPKNVVRQALRTATNRPPRACAHALDIIAEHADRTTGHNSFAGTGTIMKRTRCGERQTREKLQRLRNGHWIDVQDGPDTETAQASYAALYGDLHPLHRPAVYRVVLETLKAAPGSIVHDGTFKGCTICCPPSAQRCGIRTSQSENQRCGNGQFRGAETDTVEVRPAADIPSLTEETSSLRSTDSLILESLLQETNPPPRAGGTGLSDDSTPSGVSAAEGDEDFPFPSPTSIEIRRTMNEALLIMDQQASAFTPYYDRARAALTRLTEDGTVCLSCALLVPYWAASDEEALKGMNQRLNLSYLWGASHGYHLGLALKSDAPRKGADLFERADANIFKGSDRSDEDWESIEMFCASCKRRKIAADGLKEDIRLENRWRRGLP